MKINKKKSFGLFLLFVGLFLGNGANVVLGGVDSCGGTAEHVCDPAYPYVYADVYECPNNTGNMDGWACSCAPSTGCDSSCSGCNTCCEGIPGCNLNGLVWHSAICTDGNNNFSCLNHNPPNPPKNGCGEYCASPDDCEAGLTCDPINHECISDACSSSQQTHCVCSAPPACGNGHVDSPAEECDDGLANNGPCPKECSAMCLLNECCVPKCSVFDPCPFACGQQKYTCVELCGGDCSGEPLCGEPRECDPCNDGNWQEVKPF